MDKKQTILDWYRENHKKIDAPCGGNGTCGKCRVRFLEKAPEPTEGEKKALSPFELEQQIRLACMCEMTEEDAFVPVGAFWEERILLGCLEYTSEKVGVAIDIGTTTLVMSIVKLSNGQTIGSISQLNPQRMYGADVMTRIRAANEGKLEELQIAVKEALAQMFEELMIQAGTQYSQVKKVVLVGNTTMLHLLQGYSCEGLGRAPFSPVSLAMRKWNANMCTDKLSSEAEIWILPGISAFVGADIVSGIYACDMDLQEEVGMLVDIGTNGEMVIGNKQGFSVTATAAGPVFEGGSILCGMPAVKGAITHLNYRNGEWDYTCLETEAPRGICGSGLIDLLAAMYENHIIDENGTLSEAYFENGYTILQSMGITIYQSDIRELQMGKAAIRAGMDILKQKLAPEYIYLSGAFGKGINTLSAATIGMFDKEDIGRMSMVGNTALTGAKKFLLDEKGEQRLAAIIAKAKEVVLANEPIFEEVYIGHMQFRN